jgi:hypothetical protein
MAPENRHDKVDFKPTFISDKVEIHISDKVDFKPTFIKWDKEGLP